MCVGGWSSCASTDCICVVNGAFSFDVPSPGMGSNGNLHGNKRAIDEKTILHVRAHVCNCVCVHTCRIYVFESLCIPITCALNKLRGVAAFTVLYSIFLFVSFL